MALGFCESCKTLKPIRPTGQKWGSRECEWRPVQHDKTVHVECGQAVAPDEATYGVHYRCDKCDRFVSVQDVRVVPCDGHTRDIKNHREALPDTP